MEQKGGIKYKIECRECGKRFIVSNISSPVPKHPPKGEHVEPICHIYLVSGQGWLVT